MKQTNIKIESVELKTLRAHHSSTKKENVRLKDAVPVNGVIKPHTIDKSILDKRGYLLPVPQYFVPLFRIGI